MKKTLPPVTTTVVVHGETQDDYLPETVTVGNLEACRWSRRRFQPQW